MNRQFDTEWLKNSAHFHCGMERCKDAEPITSDNLRVMYSDVGLGKMWGQVICEECYELKMDGLSWADLPRLYDVIEWEELNE